MTSGSGWIPSDDSESLFSERTWLQGTIITAIAYGITVPLYFLSFYLLARKQFRVEFKKRLPLLIFLVVTFLLGTLFMVTTAGFTQMMFIDDRNYPGGPNGFKNTFFSIPMGASGNAAFVVSSWLSDALVVWRFKVIYYHPMCRFSLWILMFFPCLMLVGLVVLGIMLLIQVFTTNPYLVTNNVNYTVPYLGLSLALNVILTIAIVLRLLIFRYRIVSIMGPKYGTHYISIAAILIESTAFYSAVAITFIVLFNIGNAVSQVFLQSLNQFQTIAALLIVYRVARGKAWTDDSATFVMTAQRSESLELGNIQFGSFQDGTSLTLAGSRRVLDDHNGISDNIVVDIP